MPKPGVRAMRRNWRNRCRRGYCHCFKWRDWGPRRFRSSGRSGRLPARVLGQGPSKGSVVTGSGMQVDLRVLADEHFGAALLYFTGSKDHNVKMRGLAQKKGMTLNEWGLYKLDEYEKAAKKIAEAPSI